MGKITKSSDKVTEILQRGVAELIEVGNLEKKLKSGKRLRVKLGIDPTSPNVHLGRSIPLLKLRDFQELGHQIIFVVGDFTAVIGDTSDKESERPMLTKAEVKKNLKTYINQVAKLIDIKKAEIKYNSEWLSKLDYNDIGVQANAFSLSEFIRRENIKKRLDQGKRISLREVLYPLMQGYDSVALKADIELGGTDQRFNLLAGRTLQEHYKQQPQDLIMTNLIEGTDGRKMSSSWGNTINLNETAKEMFGKVMSLKDDLVIPYFIHCTRLPIKKVEKYQKWLVKGKNPRDIKILLAKEIVALYYDRNIADKQEENFISQFSQKKIPQDIKIFQLSKGMVLIDVLIAASLVSSKSEARRMLDQNAVSLNKQKVKQENSKVAKGDVIRVGKRKYIKLN